MRPRCPGSSPGSADARRRPVKWCTHRRPASAKASMIGLDRPPPPQELDTKDGLKMNRKGSTMRVRLAAVVTFIGVVASSALVSDASAHACSSSFFSKHPPAVQKLLASTPYGTK